MVVGTNETVTFINANIYDPSPERLKGTDLSLIRTHCATMQHRRRRSILRGKQVAYTSNCVSWKLHVDPSSDNHANLPTRQSYSSNDGPVRYSCIHDTHLPGPPREKKSSISTSETTTFDERCPNCLFELARATALGINCLVSFDGHRNDPFNTLPVPANAETYLSIDYCETTTSVILSALLILSDHLQTYTHGARSMTGHTQPQARVERTRMFSCQ
jgi:hypothetical protein